MLLNVLVMFTVRQLRIRIYRLSGGVMLRGLPFKCRLLVRLLTSRVRLLTSIRVSWFLYIFIKFLHIFEGTVDNK